jgi:hypothetical protein
MAEPSQNFQIRKAYFHNFSRVNMHSTQATYESIIKNGHRLLSKDIWVEDGLLSFCPTETDADNLCIAQPTIIRKHIKATLESIPGTNNQLYQVVLGGQLVNKWIAPVDIVNELGLTSNGFSCKLYQNNDILIGLTEGVHIRNYFNGLIEFQEGYTPQNLGYSLPMKITFYEYIGKVLSEGLTPGGSTEHFTICMVDEELQTKDLVEIFEDTEIKKIRKASSEHFRKAHGFVKLNYNIGDMAKVYLPNEFIENPTGITVIGGKNYFLGNEGKITEQIQNSLHQIIGQGVNDNKIFFENRLVVN